MSRSLHDMHVHTSDSPDAEIAAWELVRRGIQKGMSTIGFVAHLDLNPADYCYGSLGPPEYDYSISRAKHESDGRLTVLKGLEVGEPHRFQGKAKELVDYDEYDFIVGALHYLKDDVLILGEDAFLNGDPMGIVEGYYRESLRMVRGAEMNVLAHLGLFRRGMAMAGLDTSFDETGMWPELIGDILETLVRRGIALELNTSGLRRKEKVTYPALPVLKLYRELGGELVTVGSDSHRDPHVFYGLGEGYDMLREAGFDGFHTCSGRVFRKHRL